MVCQDFRCIQAKDFSSFYVGYIPQIYTYVVVAFSIVFTCIFRSSGVTFSLPKATITIKEAMMALIQFLASKKTEGVLWQYEDTTKSLTTLRSAEQIELFLRHVLRVFQVVVHKFYFTLCLLDVHELILKYKFNFQKNNQD